MSESTAQRVLHHFCVKFAIEMFDSWIGLPTGDELTKVVQIYDEMGFTGVMGSCDMTHVAWGCAPHSHARSYTGKEGYATLAYQAIVGHSSRLLGVTKGFHGAKNDKTMIRYDLNVQRIRESAVYTNVTYKLFKQNGTETVQKRVYLIVNGGYHQVKWQVYRMHTQFRGMLELEESVNAL